jgi:hypothetical protein
MMPGVRGNCPAVAAFRLTPGDFGWIRVVFDPGRVAPSASLSTHSYFTRRSFMMRPETFQSWM